jgi:hypothetical protein
MPAIDKLKSAAKIGCCDRYLQQNVTINRNHSAKRRIFYKNNKKNPFIRIFSKQYSVH